MLKNIMPTYMVGKNNASRSGWNGRQSLISTAWNLVCSFSYPLQVQSISFEKFQWSWQNLTLLTGLRYYCIYYQTKRVNDICSVVSDREFKKIIFSTDSKYYKKSDPYKSHHMISYKLETNLTIRCLILNDGWKVLIAQFTAAQWCR